MSLKIEQIINTKEFYDFETRQDEVTETCEGIENIQILVPIFCVAQQICETVRGYVGAMSLVRVYISK